jgi:hypothetical protein
MRPALGHRSWAGSRVSARWVSLGGHAGYGVAVGWPEDPGSLLAGPRGRRLCWVVAGGLPHQARIGPAWEQVISFDRLGAGPAELAGELAVAVARRDWAAVVAGMSEAELAGPLADSAGWAMYWQPPDGVDQALAYPQVAEALRPVARAVTGAPAARWWPGGPELGAQQYVEPVGAGRAGPALSGAARRLAAWLVAELGDERSAAARPPNPAANYSGHWWSAPCLSGLVSTTRALPGLGPLQLTAKEDWPGWSDVRCWPLTPRRPPRTWEITGPDNWVALVARYPLEVSKSRRHDWWRVTGRAGRWLIPDYAAAAADYDAIHLSVGGYLTTAGRALPVSDAGTLLAGWDPDETYWLADILDTAGPTLRWTSQDSPHPRWRPETPDHD